MVPMGKRGKLGAKTKKNLLTEDEIKVLLSVAEADAAPILHILAFTGMRVSELVHMRRNWIDWQAGFIHVPESQPCDLHYECRREIKKRGKIVKRSCVWKVKVPEAARSIPILPDLRPMLDNFFSKHESIAEVAGGREDVWRMVKSVAKRAGLNKRVFPHVLRGSLASTLAGKDFDALSIQGFMGWGSIKTADEYVRISPDRLARIVKEKWAK